MPVGFPDYYGGLTLPVTVQEGGTGQTSVTSKTMLYGAGSSALIETNVGAANQVLQINSVTLDPTFQDLVIDVSTISGILPVANGGTGTTTPALTAGSNIGISGTWPNNTIALANPLTPPVSIQSSTAVSMSLISTTNSGASLNFQNSVNVWTIQLSVGTPPTFIIRDGTTAVTVFEADSSGNVTLAVPLPVTSGGTGSSTAGSNIPSALPVPVNQGGTGTATPALTGGANINISGTWPDNTIALATTVTLGTAGTMASGVLQIANAGTGGQLAGLYSGTDTVQGVQHTLLGIVQAGVAWLVTWDLSGNMGLAGKLACGNIECALVTKYNSLSTVGVGIPSVLAEADLTGQTAATGPTTLLSSAKAGFYRISIALYVNSPTGTSTVTASVGFTQNGNAVSFAPATLNASAGHTAGGGTGEIYIDNATNITYSTTWTSGGAGDSYDIHIRLEAL